MQGAPTNRQRRLSGYARAEACAWPRALTSLPSGSVPPFPGPTIVPIVAVPPPPKLSPSAPLDERAYAVARAYVGAVERRYAKRCYVVKRGADVRRSRYYTELCLCAEALTGLGVAPGAWCAFSVDVWREHVPRGKKFFPPVGWVCSDTRIEERLDWFLSELPLYDGGQVVMGMRHRELLYRWWRMRRSVLALVAVGAPVARVEKAVQRHFSAGAWDVLVEQARAEAEMMREQLADNLREGKCLW